MAFGTMWKKSPGKRWLTTCGVGGAACPNETPSPGKTNHSVHAEVDGAIDSRPLMVAPQGEVDYANKTPVHTPKQGLMLCTTQQHRGAANASRRKAMSPQINHRLASKHTHYCNQS